MFRMLMCSFDQAALTGQTVHKIDLRKHEIASFYNIKPTR